MIDRKLNFGRHIVKAFCEESQPYASVLDIGAGKGDDLRIARSVCNAARCLALECYAPRIQMLREQGLEVYPVDVEKDLFPFQDGSIDLIIANQILEHTKELFWIFHEISRTLKPGGRLIIGVPNLASLHNRILLLIGRQPSPIKSNSSHVRGFTKGDIEQFLECWPKGYRLVDYQGSNFYPFPPAIARPLARAFPSLAWGMFLLFEKAGPYRGEFLDYPVVNKLKTNFYMGNKAETP